MDIVIKNKKEVEKICEKYNYFYLNTGLQYRTMSWLSVIYRGLGKSQKDLWEYYANSVRPPQFKLNSSDKKYPSVKNGNIIRRRTKNLGNGVSMFIKLNSYVLHRYITNKPLLEPPISIPSCPPPANLQAEPVNDGIKITWQEYIPEKNLYSGYKNVYIFSTLYYYCIGANVGNKRIRQPSKIVSIISVPSNEQFTLRHLLLSKNKLIDLKNVEYTRLHFQMDSCILVDNFAPVISFLSNITTVDWKNSKENIAEKINKQIQKVIKDKQLIQRKNILINNE